MKEIYEMHGRGHSARAIAREVGLARNTVLRYRNSPEAMYPKPRPPRVSKLDPYTEHIDRRLADGLENCVVLLRELRALGYQGSYTTLVEYVRPRRRGHQPEATMRFETAPGEQAQVDWGSLAYIGEDGKQRRVWVFVMTMAWSRACYVELVRKADTAAFYTKQRQYLRAHCKTGHHSAGKGCVTNDPETRSQKMHQLIPPNKTGIAPRNQLAVSIRQCLYCSGWTHGVCTGPVESTWFSARAPIGFAALTSIQVKRASLFAGARSSDNLRLFEIAIRISWGKH